MTELELKALDLDATKEHTVEIVGLEDKAKNISEYIKTTFKAVVDKEAPKVELIESDGDVKLIFTFSKAVDLDNKAPAGLINITDEQGVAANITTGNFKEVTDSKGTKFELALDKAKLTDGTTKPLDKADEYTVIVFVLDEKIEDTLGNKVSGMNQKITIKKDEVAPTLVKAEAIKEDKKLKKIVFQFDKEIVDNGKTAVANLFGTNALNHKTSQEEAIATLFDDKTNTGNPLTVTGAVKDKTKLEFTLSGDLTNELTGKYTFEVQAGVAKDKSLSGTENKATSVVIDFGEAEDASEDEELTATVDGTTANTIKLQFTEDVKTELNGADSATNLDFYTLNGKALPEDAKVVATDSKNIEITLPTVEDTDDAAIFEILDGKIAAKEGSKMVKGQTTAVKVKDNVAPKLVGAKLNEDGVIELEFSEKLDATAADSIILTDIEIGGKAVTKVIALNGKVSVVADSTVDLTEEVVIEVKVATNVKDEAGNQLDTDATKIKVTLK